MNLYLIAKGVYQGESLDSLLEKGDFRRATKNMCVAYLSMKYCVDALGEDWKVVQQNAGAVLGTSHGELAATANFLEEFGKNNTARPLVFQSSLHNASLGFIAKQFGITGPALTVSDKYRSGQEALEAAEILLSENICKFCFVTGVDLIPEQISSLFFKMYMDGKLPNEGAATVLLANEEGISCLKNSYSLKKWEMGAVNPSFKYDSDFIENEVSF